MHLYPSRHYLTGNKLYFEYNSEHIRKCLSDLVPETANIMIFDKDFENFELNKVERWSKTRYTDIDIPKKWIERWKFIKPLPEFHLPHPNLFLPKDFTSIVIPAEVPKYPKQLHNNHQMEVYYRPDNKLPKCHINLHLVSPLVLQSPKQ